MMLLPRVSKLHGLHCTIVTSWLVVLGLNATLKVALQILLRKFYKIQKKNSLYSQSHLIFIHRTPVAEGHPVTREIRDLLRAGSTPTGNTVYFYMSSSFIYTMKIHRRSFRQRSMKILWKILHVCYVMAFKCHYVAFTLITIRLRLKSWALSWTYRDHRIGSYQIVSHLNVNRRNRVNRGNIFGS